MMKKLATPGFRLLTFRKGKRLDKTLNLVHHTSTR
jgi:hypothetical protein